MDPIYILIACALMAWLFAAASWHKFQSPVAMAAIIDNYRVLPFNATSTMVIVLAGFEAAIALAVLLPTSRQWGALAAGVMLLTYTAAIAVNLLRGRTDFDCGCSGPAGRKTITAPLMLRNVLLVLIAAVAMSPLAARPLQWVDYIVVMLATTFFILIYQVIDKLLANRQLLARL